MKLIVVLALITLAACSTPQLKTHIPEQYLLSGFDFSEYARQGFLFTPDNYQGRYDALGIVDLYYMPEARYEEREMEFRGRTIVADRWSLEKAEPQRAIEGLYREAKNMGADAVTKFRIEPATLWDGGKDNRVKLSGYKVSGFAIKRR